MMDVVPATRPATIPVVDPTLPISGALLDQVPPRLELVSVIVEPTQTFVGPTIGGAAVTTFTVVVL